MVKLKDLLNEGKYTVYFDMGSPGLMSKTVDAKNEKGYKWFNFLIFNLWPFAHRGWSIEILLIAKCLPSAGKTTISPEGSIGLFEGLSFLLKKSLKHLNSFTLKRKSSEFNP